MIQHVKGETLITILYTNDMFSHMVTVLENYFFFFQAEDGIRDGHVTGVQTCAHPICGPILAVRAGMPAEVWTCLVCRSAYLRVTERDADDRGQLCPVCRRARAGADRGTSPAYRISRRSEERRVGQEGRSGRGRAALSR